MCRSEKTTSSPASARLCRPADVAAFLSESWLSEVTKLINELPPRPGLTATMQVIVEGAPDGKIQLLFSYDDGKVTEAGFGRNKDADIELIVSHERALGLAADELDLRVLFMAGDIKVSGAYGPFLRLLESTVTPDHAAMREQVGAITEQ